MDGKIIADFLRISKESKKSRLLELIIKGIDIIVTYEEDYYESDDLLEFGDETMESSSHGSATIKNEVIYFDTEAMHDDPLLIH